MAIHFKNRRGGVVYSFPGEYFNIPRKTQTQVDDITSREEGDIVYNTTTQNFIGWTGSNWENLIQEASLGTDSIGVDTVIVTSFDEFGYDTKIKSSSDGSKYFNAIYEWLVKGVVPISTDFTYTIRHDISRIGHLKNVVFWVNWFSETTTFLNPTQIRPALQDSIKNEINVTDWEVGGYQADSLEIINIPTTYSISGSQNDQSLLNGMLEIQERGYKPSFLPVTRYIDTANQNEEWRGTINWDNYASFQLWMAEYEVMYKHYIDLFYNNGIDLGISYLGSEMASLSRDNALNSDIQKRWVDGLIELAKYTKNFYPNTIVTYGADWTEYRHNLDRLWVSPYLDRIGIEFYFPITVTHTNNASTIARQNWQGEGYDYFFDGQNSAESLATTSSGVGKSQLNNDGNPLNKDSQTNNWRAWRDSSHYKIKRANAIADASPLAISPDIINTIYDSKSSEIMQGTSVLQTTANKLFEGPSEGPNRKLFKENCWLYSSGSTFSNFQIPIALETNTQKINSFKLEIDFDILNNHSSSFPRLIRFDNWLDIFYDVAQSTLKMEWKQATANAFLNAPSTNYTSTNLNIEVTYDEVDAEYDVFISVNNELVTQAFFTLSADTTQAIFTNNIVYVSSFAGTSDFLESNIYRLNYHFGIDGEYYGGTYNFEDEVFGVRNEYDARFTLPNKLQSNIKPVMATELGIASINGSTVEPNVFPAIDTSGTGYIPSGNTQNYWETAKTLGLEIVDIKGPYGSTFESDELHQQVALTTILNQIKQAGVAETALYNLDARYYLSFKAVENGILWYKDGGNHIYNHAMNGKKILGYDRKIYDSINPNNTFTGDLLENYTSQPDYVHITF